MQKYTKMRKLTNFSMIPDVFCRFCRKRDTDGIRTAVKRSISVSSADA